MDLRFLFKESLTALISAPIRSLLTMLGVIIGVAAVIAMMSIGGGAKLETLRQIRALGATNIYVKSSRLTGDNLKRAKQALSRGLSRDDYNIILQKLPYLDGATFELTLSQNFKFRKKQPKSNLIGIGPSYFDLIPTKLDFGRYFNDQDYLDSRKVVLLGSKISKELFGNMNPVGKFVKIGNKSFEIQGVLASPNKTNRSATDVKDDIKIGERERQRDIYLPYTTILNRFQLALKDVEDSEQDPTYSELSMIIIKLTHPEPMLMVRNYLNQILKLRHKGVNDYQIIAPVDLLEKSNQVQEIFNMVMVFIASLSLIVGGIGIMNIMLANIQQRIKEIGIRRAIGATRKDILLQFLFEAIMISVGGGVLGVFLGILTSAGIAAFTGWTTVLSTSSIFISFLVSVSVGLIFGIFPARKASEMDPIAALRYE
tara:strand:- start:12341 stop:13624 length:1284 start_codon:yes stop_codon:yes gene_type:complete